MVQRPLIAALRLALAIAAPAVAPRLAQAQGAPHFPQPVRAADLRGRAVVQPVEAQHLLGRVDGVVTKDGAELLVIDQGGTFSLSTRKVAVPLDAVALVGELVALEDLTPAQLDAAPTFDPAGAAPVPPDAMLRVGIAGPFH